MSQDRPDHYNKLSRPETVSHRFTTADGRLVEIRDVWMSNIDEEMENIRNIIEDFPYVAMVIAIFGKTISQMSSLYL